MKQNNTFTQTRFGSHSMNRCPRPQDRSFLIRHTVIAFFAVLVLGTGIAVHAGDESSKRFEINAKPLADALMEFGAQSGLTVVAPTSLTADKNAAAVHGDLAPGDALRQLLKGSGLTFVRAADGTIDIQKIESSPPVQASARQTGLEEDLTSATSLTEIVVTAQKKEERALDVPVAVTGIDAQTLVNSNLITIQDYYSQVPGLNYSTGIFGEPQISIRGLSTGLYTSPTVGIVLDDVPIGPTTVLAGGYLVPDLDPSDLSRIEVLRGPQGTLYGANSLGGLVKFVTVDPSTTAWTARAEAGTSNIAGSGTLGYTARGALNAPVTDQLAIRANGFYRENSGYIDDVESGRSDVNRTRTDGARVAALWQPAQDFSIKVGALYQEQRLYGSSESDITIGDRKQSTLGNTGLLNVKMQVYTATLKTRVADIDILALSSYSIFGVRDALDVSEALSSLTGTNGSEQTDDRTTDKLTQEVHFSGRVGKTIDWLVGGYFANEHTAWQQNYYVINPSTLAMAGTPLLLSSVPSNYKETAGFADLTVHLTDRFKVQVGGREAENHQLTNTGNSIGVLAGAPALPERISENAFTYLVAPSFQLSPDQMAYARLATGFRPGGPNNCQLLPISCQYGSDRTTDYEVGLKEALLDHTLSLDASVYYIDWKNIALNLSNGILSYFGNVGSAKSQGVELAGELKPTAHIKMNGWVAWNQAQLTANLPVESGITGGDGDRLPGSARWSGNVSISVNHPLIDTVTGFATVSASYVGDRLPNIGAPGPQVFPGYAQFDANGGITSGPWTANLSITNIANKRGVIGGGFLPTEYYFITPRTIGLSLSRRFGE